MAHCYRRHPFEDTFLKAGISAAVCRVLTFRLLRLGLGFKQYIMLGIYHIWVVYLPYQDFGPILSVDTAVEQVPQSTVIKLLRQRQQQVLGQVNGYGQLRQDLIVQNMLWE